MASLMSSRYIPARLLRVAAEAGITDRDPLRPVFEELDIITEKLVMLPGQCQQKFETLDARLTAILEDSQALAGGRLARQAAAEIPAAVDRVVLMRYWWLTVFVGVILALGIYGGYWYGERTRQQELVQLSAGFDMVLTRQNAESWLNLMRQNPQPTALEDCRPIATTGNGSACSYALWRRAPTVP